MFYNDAKNKKEQKKYVSIILLLPIWLVWGQQDPEFSQNINIQFLFFFLTYSKFVQDLNWNKWARVVSRRRPPLAAAFDQYFILVLLMFFFFSTVTVYEKKNMKVPLWTKSEGIQSELFVGSSSVFMKGDKFDLSIKVAPFK